MTKPDEIIARALGEIVDYGDPEADCVVYLPHAAAALSALEAAGWAVVPVEPDEAETERLAHEATEVRFETRLSTKDQRNGYEVGWYEGYLTAQRSMIHAAKGDRTP